MKLALDFSCALASSRVVAQGEFDFSASLIQAVMGPSGVGKTTLARWIAGLIPSHGNLKWNGDTWESDSSRLSPQARNIGFVAQGDWLFPHLTVAENIAFGLRGAEKDAREDRVRSLMALTGTAALAGRYPRSLSGGEKRRVALAQVLAPDPELLILDEPFTGLDSEGKKALWVETKSWIESAELPTILITHELEEAGAFTSRIHKFQNGRLIL